MSDELKPCPFCGGKASWIAARQREDGAYYPAACGCRKCGIWRYGESDYGHSGFATEEDFKVSMEQAVAKWNTRVDDAPEQFIKKAESYKQDDEHEPLIIDVDTREKLEADIYYYLSESATKPADAPLFTHIISWLDRQEAITEFNCRMDYEDMRDYLQVQVDSLTAELACKPKQAVDKQADSREKLEADVRESYENGMPIKAKVLDWLDRQDAITERKHDFDSIVMDELRKQRDELEAELKHKQHVCDVQRDSFLKMERENTEMRRTIEDMRGD